MTLTAVDLSQLKPPQAIKELSFESFVQEMRDDIVARFPAIAPVVDLPSEPVRKLIEVFAYRELLVRQRVNDAAQAVMLATATGSDLENLASFFGVTRAEEESDDRLRRRTSLAVEAYSTAGPIGAYKFHALTAAPEVKDVSVTSPAPGQVLVTLLGAEGGGAVSQSTVLAVREALNAEHVRPLTDVVSVKCASIITYSVDAGLTILPGPAPEPIVAKAQEAVTAYVQRRHGLGRDITVSGLMGALHVDGVQRVTLRAPADLPITVRVDQAAFCEAVTVKYEGRDA